MYVLDAEWRFDLVRNVDEAIKMGIPHKNKMHVLITYQPVPIFHKEKIEQFIQELKTVNSISLNYQLYEKETHMGLFLPSLIKGLEWQME